jgi:hypothetical protein
MTEVEARGKEKRRRGRRKKKPRPYPSSDRNLLVLDLDETLIYACDDPRRLAKLGEPDFCAAGYPVFKRPHLDYFLASEVM